MHKQLTAVGGVLAPGGTLRAAINYGNVVLAQKDQLTGEPAGVSVALARRLAAYLSLPLKMHIVESAGAAVEAVRSNICDLGFFAIDPKRASNLAFSKPYIIIEGAYLSRKEAPFSSIKEVDRAGIRIAVGKNAVYDLYLSRMLKHAEIVRAQTTPGAVDLYLEKKLELAAGIKTALLDFVVQNPEHKVLEGSFMQIEQAIGVSCDRQETVVPFLNEFLTDMLSKGFIRDQLEQSGQDPHLAISQSRTKADEDY